MDETEVVAGQTRGLTYRLEIRTRDAAERFIVRAGVPSAFGAPGFAFGGTLQGAQLAGARLDGPGRLRYDPGPQAAPPARCSRFFAVGHGLRGDSGGSLLIELPEHNATSTLIVPTQIATDPPWPGREYRLDFVLDNAGLDPGFPGTLDGSGTVEAPVVPYRGPRGTRILLDSAPATGCGAGLFGGPPLRQRSVDLVGVTDPPLPPGQTVRLDAVLPGATTPTLLARVPVASDGTFAMRDWRPGADGFYEVAARYESQSPELADDFSDPINFNLERPRPALRLASRTARASLRGLIRLPVACPLATAGGCRGRLRIERVGVPIASARFELAGGTRRTLQTVLTATGRRLLRHSRSVAVRVRVTDGTERVRSLVLLPPVRSRR